MFRAVILPIFRSTRLCVTASGIMHPRCYLPATSWVHYTRSCNTQSSAPEDGQNNCPKHVELIGIINKPLLLHLVGCLYYLYQWCTVKQISNISHILGSVQKLEYELEKNHELTTPAKCGRMNLHQAPKAHSQMVHFLIPVFKDFVCISQTLNGPEFLLTC